MYVIIGQGAAGTAAAAEIKRRDPEAKVLMLTEELDNYYSRIDLPAIISGSRPLEKCILKNEKDFEELGVDVISGVRVTSVDRENHSVALEDGRTFSYEKLLLATGSHSALPAGVEKADGLYTLWTLQDAFAIRKAAENASCAVVVGGGLIGVKSALALKSLGLDVTLAAGRRKRLMPQQLDEYGSEVLKAAVEKKGVRVLTGGGVDEFLSENGKITGIRVGAETVLGDIVLVATGTKANTELAEAAGLEVGRGILVDSSLCTSDKDIFAAGNAAEMTDINGEKIVSATWGSAVSSGQLAGKNMVGGSKEIVPYLMMNSVEIAGIPIVSAGNIVPAETDRVEIEKQADYYRKAVYTENGVLKSFLQMGRICDSGIFVNALRRRLNNRLDVSGTEDYIRAFEI